MPSPFDTVPRQHLLEVLADEYGLDKSMLEAIRRVLTDTRGQVPGGKQPFQTTMGVKQGCPMSPLLFALYFDRVVKYIQTHTTTHDAVHIASLTLQAALYADDVILAAPSPSSLQAQLTCVRSFASSESLRVSGEKTIVLLEKCSGAIKLGAQQL